VSAQARRFREDGLKLELAKSKATEFGQGGLLPLQFQQAVVAQPGRIRCPHFVFFRPY
jgi:hypothetical protein